MGQLKLYNVSENLALQTVLEFAGKKMDPASESTLRERTSRYNSTYEGARPIDDLADDSVDAVTRKSYAKAQTGKEVALRSTNGYIMPVNPWPKTAEVADRDMAFASTKKRRYWHKQDQGNCWDLSDSSSTASASASAKEGGTYGMPSMSEREWNSWGPRPPQSISGSQVQTTLKHDMQPANRGDNP